MRTGPVSFRGLRSVARIFSPLLENQVVLPEYYRLFWGPKMAIKKIMGEGVHPLATASYAYT